MISVLAATATEFAELQPVRRSLLILGRNVVAAFAFVTLKDNVIAWHVLNPDDCSEIGPIGPIPIQLLPRWYRRPPCDRLHE